MYPTDSVILSWKGQRVMPYMVSPSTHYTNELCCFIAEQHFQ